MYDQQLLDTEMFLDRPFEWSLGLDVQVVDFLVRLHGLGNPGGFYAPGGVTVSLPEMVSERRTVEVRIRSCSMAKPSVANQGRVDTRLTLRSTTLTRRV
jgi:hypothetical protein